MGKVTIHRKKCFSGSALIFQVCCDGKVVASVRNGESTTFNIDAEEHCIQCTATTTGYIYGYNGTVSGSSGGTVGSDVITIPRDTSEIVLHVEMSLSGGFLLSIASIKTDKSRSISHSTSHSSSISLKHSTA